MEKDVCRECGSLLNSDRECPRGCGETADEVDAALGPDEQEALEQSLREGKCCYCGASLVCEDGCYRHGDFEAVEMPHVQSALRNGICPTCRKLIDCPNGCLHGLYEKVV